MAWPPVIPPNTRQNITPELDNHPSDHNALADALSAIVALIPAAGALPWGRVASATAVANPSCPSGTDTTLATVTFTAVAGRRYRVTTVMQVVCGGAGATVFGKITDANGQLQMTTTVLSANWQGTFTVAVEVPPGGAGSRTYSGKIWPNAAITGNAAASQPHSIMVEDIGV